MELIGLIYWRQIWDILFAFFYFIASLCGLGHSEAGFLSNEATAASEIWSDVIETWWSVGGRLIKHRDRP